MNFAGNTSFLFKKLCYLGIIWLQNTLFFDIEFKRYDTYIPVLPAVKSFQVYKMDFPKFIHFNWHKRLTRKAWQLIENCALKIEEVVFVKMLVIFKPHTCYPKYQGRKYSSYVLGVNSAVGPLFTVQ